MIKSKLDKKLLSLAKKNKTPLALSALEKGATLTCVSNKFSYKGWNALHFASYHGNNELVKAILKNKKNLQYINDRVKPGFSKNKNKGNESILDIAGKKGHIDTIKLLIDYKEIEIGVKKEAIRRIIHYLNIKRKKINITKISKKNKNNILIEIAYSISYTANNHMINEIHKIKAMIFHQNNTNVNKR